MIMTMMMNDTASGKPHLQLILRLRVTEIDLCKANNGGCDHKCSNYGGHVVCQCHEGYQLMKDQKSCEGNRSFNHDKLCMKYSPLFY